MHTFTMDTAVFFNLFAAVEPSANACVAHGTQRNGPSVCIATTATCEFPPRQCQLLQKSCPPNFIHFMLRSRSRKFWKGRSCSGKVGVGVRHFTSVSATLDAMFE